MNAYDKYITLGQELGMRVIDVPDAPFYMLIVDIFDRPIRLIIASIVFMVMV